MCSPSPPPPPDYTGAAVAQGAANKESAIASNLLNNPNVVNPYGTQTWVGGEGGERPTVTQTFSPEQQALYQKTMASKGMLADLGTQGATAMQGLVGKQFDMSGAPPPASSAEETRTRVINAMMGRANEDYAKQSDQANSDLIAAGIRPGTKAYADKQQMIERARTDARNQAEVAGGNAASQAYTMDADRRKAAIAEMLAQRQVPLNEITALMSGSQVSNPFAVPNASQNTNIAPSPIFGATQAQAGAANDIFNAQSASANSTMNGLLKLGATAAMFMSDRRLKSDIRRIGTHPLGIGIYEYTIFGGRDIGVMADEVLQVRPEAVSVHPSGYMQVDYGRL